MNTTTAPKVPDQELIVHLQTIYATLVLLDETLADHERRLRASEALRNAGGRE